MSNVTAIMLAGDQLLMAANLLRALHENACRALDPTGRAFVNVNHPEVLSELDRTDPKDTP